MAPPSPTAKPNPPPPPSPVRGATAADPVIVLSDWIDAQRPAITKLGGHAVPLAPGLELVLGHRVLTAPWLAHRARLSQPDARALLVDLCRPGPGHALDILRRLDHELWAAPAPTNDDVLFDRLSNALATGQVWALAVRHVKHKTLVGHPDASKLKPINAALKCNVDFDLLSQWEGHQWLIGYVPIHKKDHKVVDSSGVTVASGVDLGQQSDPDLKRIGVSQAVRDKLSPYLGKQFRGYTEARLAAFIVNAGPMPYLSKGEADELDAAVMCDDLRRAQSLWDKSKNPQLPAFKDLPSGWQTVWFSRAYQGGLDFLRHPLGRPFGLAAIKGDWQGAIAALRVFPAAYADRGRQEADACEAELPKAPGPPVPGLKGAPPLAPASNTPTIPSAGPGAPALQAPAR